MWDVGRGVSAKSQHPRFGKRKHVHAAEKEFIIATVASACVYSGFSLIAYWLVGPIGVIAELAVFQCWFFRNLDTLLIKMERS